MPPASAIESPLIYEISEGSLSKAKNLETIESEILPNLGENKSSQPAQKKVSNRQLISRLTRHTSLYFMHPTSAGALMQ